MKDDQLDHIIKAKLQNLQVDQRPMDWDVLEEKLQNANSGGPANAEDQAFDQVIFERLNQFSASGTHKEKHWAVFERQLNQLASFRERLLQYKLIEAILVSLLLLLTVELGFPTVQPTPFSSPATAENFQKAANLSNEAINEVHPQTSNKEALHPANQASNTSLNSEGKTVTLGTDKSLLSSAKDPLTPSDFIESTPIDAASSGANSLLQNIQTPLFSETLDENLQENRTLLGPLAPIDARQSILLNLGQQPNMETPISPLKRTNLQISMFGGIDYDRVMTPENTAENINAIDRYALGYRGGLMLDVGRINSRLRLGAGLIYTAKQYEVGISRIHGNLINGDGWTVEKLDNIELNMVNLPVFARYNLLEGKRWSVFAHAGLAMQVALQANYYVDFPDNLPAPVRQFELTPRSYSKVEDRTGGFFEGGSFEENSFFTGNLGLGLERHVADRWSLFMQSRYEYSIGYLSAGLGPTQDRINTMSFESGIRVKLK